MTNKHSSPASGPTHAHSSLPSLYLSGHFSGGALFSHTCGEGAFSCTASVNLTEIKDGSGDPYDRDTKLCEGFKDPQRRASWQGTCTFSHQTGTNAFYAMAFEPDGSLQWFRGAEGGDVTVNALAHIYGGGYIDNEKVGSSASMRFQEGLEFFERARSMDLLVVGGVVRGGGLVDFGRTKFPLKCSSGRALGEKGLIGVEGSSRCSGRVRGQGVRGKGDVLVVMLEASTGEVLWIRRTGMRDREVCFGLYLCSSKEDTMHALKMHL